MTQKNKNLKIMTECAVMVALGAVLSLIRVVKMPLGGSVTLFSMLPICIFSVRRGVKSGLICGFLHGLLQLALDFGEVIGWGLTPAALIGCFVFDYLLAFTSVGIAGIFRRHGRIGMCLGAAAALFLRLLSHIVSGTLIFDAWLPEDWSDPLLYSVSYNGAFMLPELIFTALAVFLLSKTPILRVSGSENR